MSYTKFFLLSLLLLSVPQKNLQSKCACTSTGARKLRRIEIRDLLKDMPSWRHDLTHEPPYFARTSNATLAEHADHLVIAAQVAETLQHHPDLVLTSTELQVTIFTHSQQELTEKDATFIRKYEAELAQKSEVEPTPIITFDSTAIDETIEGFLEKNPDWIWADSGLILHKNAADFKTAAQFLFVCCTTSPIAHFVHAIGLSYGALSVILCDKTTDNQQQLLSAAELCARLLHNFIPEK